MVKIFEVFLYISFLVYLFYLMTFMTVSHLSLVLKLIVGCSVSCRGYFLIGRGFTIINITTFEDGSNSLRRDRLCYRVEMIPKGLEYGIKISLLRSVEGYEYKITKGMIN